MRRHLVNRRNYGSTDVNHGVHRIMPAALVPRSWDFDPAPGTPNLVPVHGAGPLEQSPPHGQVNGESGRPSGELPSISLHTETGQTPTPPKPENSVSDSESTLPDVTIIPPTLRSLPLEVQLQA